MYLTFTGARFAAAFWKQDGVVAIGFRAVVLDVLAADAGDHSVLALDGLTFAADTDEDAERRAKVGPPAVFDLVRLITELTVCAHHQLRHFQCKCQERKGAKEEALV